MHIDSDEVHIWRIDLGVSTAEAEYLRGSLSADEVQRAGRFHFAHDVRRFIAGRGMLRSILGGYIGAAPRDVRFTYGPHGKPALAHPRHTLGFNLSHAEDTALCAVTGGCEAGIDVERLRSWPEAGSIVAGYFTPAEIAAFERLPAADRELTFVRWWTRKEAYLKALGAGHGEQLDSVDMLHGPDSPHWLVCDIDGLPGHCAALVLGVDPSTVT